MKKHRSDVIKQHYEPRIEKFDSSYEVLDWESQSSQYKRFQVLADNVELEGKSILDMGCGLGDLNVYLKTRIKKFSYTGVDVLEKMIVKARQKNPDAQFVLADVGCTWPFDANSFDVVYCSGMFNLNTGDNGQMLAGCIPKFSEIARETVAVSLLSTASPNPDPTYAYFDPDQAALIARKSAIRVDIVEGYLENDFTLLIHL